MSVDALWPRVHAASLAVLLLGSGCIDVTDLRELAALQSGIGERFKEPAVSVNLTNRVYLDVTFQNSRRADLPADERAAFAREVAGFVRDHYAGYAELEAISVGFAVRRGVGPVSMTRTSTPYRFFPAELASPFDSSAAGEQGGADRVILKSADQWYALTYRCDHFESAASSKVKDAILRTHGRRIARQAAQQGDDETLEQLIKAYEGSDTRVLERLVVEYVCEHGVVPEEVSGPVFPEPGSSVRELVSSQPVRPSLCFAGGHDEPAVCESASESPSA